MAIRLAVTPTGLRVLFTGLDRAAACRRGLHVPFERIVGSRVMSRRTWWPRAPSCPAPAPGGRETFRWGPAGSASVDRCGVPTGGADVVVVYLSGRPFHRVVVEVDDCRQAHRLIDAVLLYSKKCGARQLLRAMLGENG